ncbi:MAG: polysaccharide lyase family 7 protein [Flavobacteriaceae bacterium]
MTKKKIKNGIKKGSGFAFILLVLLGSCSEENFTQEVASDATEEFVVAFLTTSQIQAEDFDVQNGVQLAGGGWKVGYINNGDWIRFDDFDYSGANSVTVMASSGTGGGTIEFRTGSPTNDLLGVVEVTNTGGWGNMEAFTANIDDDSDNSDLYLVFKGDSGYLFDIDSFNFSSSSTNPPSDGTNLALGKVTEQSSTAYNGAASRAVDGNTSGVWGGGSVTHTSSTYQPWWQVRLGDEYEIGEIVIWNRTNCSCATRLSNFDVFVYNDAGSQVYKTTIIDTPNPSVTINTGGVVGSRVRVKLKDTNSLSLAEVQVFGTEGAGNPPPGDANIPSDLMSNCNQWKITYPDGVEDKTLCGEGNNEYFYVNDDKNGIVFRTPIRSNNGTTPNSEYVRSELREREEDGSQDIYWTTDGTHVVYVRQAITNLPDVKDHLVATQVHGNKSDGIDDAMVLRLEGNHLFLSFNGGELRDDLTVKNGYALGTMHEVIFEIKEGKHYCYYSEDGNLKSAYTNGNASNYLVKDGGSSVVMDKDYDDAYFKIGNYTQSNYDIEGNRSNNYGEVIVYDYFVEH